FLLLSSFYSLLLSTLYHFQFSSDTYTSFLSSNGTFIHHVFRIIANINKPTATTAVTIAGIQPLPLRRSAGTKDHIKTWRILSRGVIAVSSMVLDLFSGSTILSSTNPMAYTPVEYPYTNNDLSNQFSLLKAYPNGYTVNNTTTRPANVIIIRGAA